MELSDIISQTDEPLILPNYLKWNIIQWDLQKWNDVLGNEELEFRYGHNIKTENPQWEKNTPLIKGTLEDLLNFSQTDRWLYFDYKYLNQWLLKAKELREQINFSDLGLKNVTADESTIWIGTKGAHTPCHIDTYGCNVVVQIFGHKLWLLFKPDENLKATRIPYEESTIYSKLNFFSPSKISDFEGIQDGKLVILKPGDVLIIPNKWWHYVEALDTSISINTWLPLQQDHLERQRECLLQLFIGSLLNNGDSNMHTSILNPNSYDVLKQPLSEGIKLFQENLKRPPFENVVENNLKLCHFLDTHSFIRRIGNLSKENLLQFLENQSKRFSNTITHRDELEENAILKKIIHAITHPDVINMILKKINE
ncbi:HSPB1-associated protein 1 isoform X1 [Harmonia axyridis]|uniref:HSPB1-associated protein 1 isoform X1 n=1 Tax=Harmonia axyridis TaxID=115357 RepID=UPI001E27884E|nr:HSPB1-associated protein 1 isoform X1 [Harmonia axyridis]